MFVHPTHFKTETVNTVVGGLMGPGSHRDHHCLYNQTFHTKPTWNDDICIGTIVLSRTTGGIPRLMEASAVRLLTVPTCMCGP
ncbi:hypothetical protein NFI96_012709, partial [Prochilodus magdalenae]